MTFMPHNFMKQTQNFQFNFFNLLKTPQQTRVSNASRRSLLQIATATAGDAPHLGRQAAPCCSSVSTQLANP